VVYGRTYGDRELNFEASGALMDAALIMRDRETDSWWSIMRSRAIGGELEGSELHELPYGEKTTWARWRARHPKTLVLSVDGTEHIDGSPYADYFGSERTFRDLEVSDDRLAPKAPIFAFWLDGRPYAVAHAVIRSGKLAEAETEEGPIRLYFHRQRDAHLHASSAAFRLTGELAEVDAKELAKRLRAAVEGRQDAALTPLEGFDTFWYTWAKANPKTMLVR